MPLLYDAQRWRDRAEEVRTRVEAMRSAEARDTMLAIAAGYDRMADRIEMTLREMRDAK